jgi:hypothetical protein
MKMPAKFVACVSCTVVSITHCCLEKFVRLQVRLESLADFALKYLNVS